MPSSPPAPGLFSITTGCFSSRDSASATGRATVSATPPGGNGTIIVTGRSGYGACPRAAGAASTPTIASAIAAHLHNSMLTSSPLGQEAVLDLPDAVDRHADDVARLQPARRVHAHADAGGRARGDHVARMQRDAARAG